MTPDDFGTALQTAKEYIDLIVKPPLQQVGEILGDKMSLWTTRNKVKVLVKAKRYCEAQGIRPEKLLPDVFVPLMNEAGNVSDETLQELFARLIAEHLDPNGVAVHPAFAKVIVQLAPLDARLLVHIDSLREYGQRSNGYTDARWREFIGEKRIVTEVILAMTNLERLGLCVGPYPAYESNDVPAANNNPVWQWELTPFAAALLNAVGIKSVSPRVPPTPPTKEEIAAAPR